MILLTVGTVMPFDRLVKAIDQLVNQGMIQEEIFGQIGLSTYQPKNFKYTKELSSDVFEQYMEQADKVVGHAGIGTIVMSLQYKKPLLVMPRMKKYSEHVNDHQFGTATRFEAEGHVLAAYTEKQLLEKLKALDGFTPLVRDPDIEGIVNRVSAFIKATC